MDSEEGECGEEIRHRADVDSNEEAEINVDTRDLELCFDFFELFFLLFHKIAPLYATFSFCFLSTKSRYEQAAKRCNNTIHTQPTTPYIIGAFQDQ